MPVNLAADFFTLFQLPATFRIDLAELDARYLALQGEVHPDRFVGAGDAERRRSMQWATRANEAYQTLKKPLERAKYLLTLAGHDIEAEKNTSMEPAFLMEQMEWREAVMAARNDGNHHELERLHYRLAQDLRARYERLASLLDDEQNLTAAAAALRRLMFLEKLRADIDDALVALEDVED
ncbi:MAG: Fe-S protein assembly co-chaperone HscB [Zoogloeaceae bacterium]|nr:Fe-S protein assembly co-chaperone HscB [Zoogloeaceae bacterium]